MAIENSSGAYLSYGTASALGAASDWSAHLIVTPTVNTGADSGLLAKRSGFSSGTNQYNVVLGSGNSRIPIATKDDKFILFAPGFSLNTEYILTFSCSSSGIKCFVNGSSRSSSFSNHSQSSNWQTGALASSATLETFSNGAGSEIFRGVLSEVALWSVALSDAEIASLHKRFSPSRIRPSALCMYWDYRGGVNTEKKQGYAVTQTGSFSKAAHPRIYA